MPLMPYADISFAAPAYRFTGGKMETGLTVRSPIEFDATVHGYDQAKADALLKHIQGYIDGLPVGSKPDFIDLEKG
jgi:hypothetical protein